MAYISQRGAYWRAEIRRRGFKPAYRTFDTRQLAQQWARRTESEMDAGVYVDRSQAERTTLKEALERYRLEVLPSKKSPKQESGRIDRWLRTDLAHRTLANLRGADFARYRDVRRAEGRAENTIRLELQLVSHLYETARKEWGMEGLLNPLQNIRKPSGSAARERRLQDGEYEAIRGYLALSGNVYALPAFDLAIETSLRQGMLFAIQWEWVDLNARLIRIPAAWRRAGNKGVSNAPGSGLTPATIWAATGRNFRIICFTAVACASSKGSFNVFMFALPAEASQDGFHSRPPHTSPLM